MSESSFAEGYAVGQGNNANGGLGGYGWEWIWIIILFAFWGNGGWGYGNNGGGGGALTRADLCSEFNFNGLENGIRGIQQGICDSTYALNNTINNGFYSTQNAILTNGYESRLATQGLSAQLASCCCDVERGLDRIACQSATDTAAIIQATKDGTQAILGYLCNEKIEALRAENTLLTSQLSQNAQTRTIIDSIRQVPVPSYVVPNPYTGSYGYAGYGSCGCNSGCACGAFGF